jgi:ribonucleoside-diphosphate reductase alpha chain
MVNGIFLPNSPAIYNAGFTNMYHACCVMPIEDDMKSIAEFKYRTMMMFKYGAGVGTNFSFLREKDAPLSGGGKSSGIVSLMESINGDTEYVKQGGYRRGAFMSILDYDHPEIINFVTRKLRGGLENMNLSVMVDNKFMEQVNKKNHDLFDIISFCSWMVGCPGLLFFDRINQDNKLYPTQVINATNPCSESPLPDNTLCTLGSINLSELVNGNNFDMDRFIRIIRFVSNILVSLNQNGYYPFPEFQENMLKYNPIGLGIMGFADCLIKLGIYYDSKECLEFIDKIGEVLKRVTNESTSESFYHNILAPTGSLSILADCSSGIEPVFNDVFERNLVAGKFEETRKIYKSQYTRLAHDIEPEWHIKVLAQWQKWIDGGVSKTINMPYDTTVHNVKNAFKLAWKLGCKGITIYRDTSKENQPLRKVVKCEGEECSL